MPGPNTPLLWRADAGPVVDRLAAVRHLALADPTLGVLIGRVGAFTLEPPPRQSPFHYLQRAIVHQQLSGKAAATIFERFVRIYKEQGHPTPTEILGTSEGILRRAGLSTAKARAILDLARHAQRRAIPSKAEMSRIGPVATTERLCRIRGVGPWTAEMLLMFYHGHPDLLPLGDLGIRKGFQLTYRMRGLPSPRTVARQGERWRPYRTMASWYLWRALELPRP